MASRKTTLACLLIACLAFVPGIQAETVTEPVAASDASACQGIHLASVCFTRDLDCIVVYVAGNPFAMLGCD